jgi:Ca2+-dependent lipid-binding protein
VLTSKIQLWDKDVIGSNELIGETSLDLNTHRMIDKAVKRKKTVRMLQRIREQGG